MAYLFELLSHQAIDGAIKPCKLELIPENHERDNTLDSPFQNVVMEKDRLRSRPPGGELLHLERAVWTPNVIYYQTGRANDTGRQIVPSKLKLQFQSSNPVLTTTMHVGPIYRLMSMLLRQIGYLAKANLLWIKRLLGYLGKLCLLHQALRTVKAQVPCLEHVEKQRVKSPGFMEGVAPRACSMNGWPT